ncbi:hypothetical protein BDZ89DRAFT_1118583 [Hymenopellis radicata]|nr:hypothetical protein BDZ89DRAFT_1118583 [Hymenopellis radicata]
MSSAGRVFLYPVAVLSRDVSSSCVGDLLLMAVMSSSWAGPSHMRRVAVLGRGVCLFMGGPSSWVGHLLLVGGSSPLVGGLSAVRACFVVAVPSSGGAGRRLLFCPAKSSWSSRPRSKPEEVRYPGMGLGGRAGYQAKYHLRARSVRVEAKRPPPSQILARTGPVLGSRSCALKHANRRQKTRETPRSGQSVIVDVVLNQERRLEDAHRKCKRDLLEAHESTAGNKRNTQIAVTERHPGLTTYWRTKGQHGTGSRNHSGGDRHGVEMSDETGANNGEHSDSIMAGRKAAIWSSHVVGIEVAPISSARDGEVDPELRLLVVETSTHSSRFTEKRNSAGVSRKHHRQSRSRSICPELRLEFGRAEGEDSSDKDSGSGTRGVGASGASDINDLSVLGTFSATNGALEMRVTWVASPARLGFLGKILSINAPLLDGIRFVIEYGHIFPLGPAWRGGFAASPVALDKARMMGPLRNTIFCATIFNPPVTIKLKPLLALYADLDLAGFGFLDGLGRFDGELSKHQGIVVNSVNTDASAAALNTPRFAGRTTS